MKKITKAIIPVAGLGTRILPASKTIPKEMFPIVDRPVIHYIVKEAVESGIRDIIFVTSSTKRSLEDYFDVNCELESALVKKGKKSQLELVREMTTWANYYFVRQGEPRGDGDAILRARRLLAPDEACVVMWGDDVIIGAPVIKQMIKLWEKYQAPIVAVEEITGPAIEKYGVIAGKKVAPNLYHISHIIENPKLEEAPSKLGIVGHYIMTSEVVDALIEQEPAPDGEIRFSHALRDALVKTPVYAYRFSGQRFDCGSKLGWIQANIAMGLKDKEIGRDLKKYLAEFKPD